MKKSEALIVSRVFLYMLAVLLLSAPARAEATNGAVMQGLDKVTARVSTFALGVGETAVFGALKIKLFHCDRTPPEETPESTAFIEVTEEKRAQEPVNLFSGWMFASSPALSSIEHPVYDVWVLECVDQMVEPDGNGESTKALTPGQ